MEIFCPEFQCIDGNSAAKFVKEGFELLTLCVASNRSYQLTVEDLDNFYLIPHYLKAYPYKHGNFPLVSISQEIFPLNGKFSKNILIAW
jgi:hypothetical protein